MKNKKYIFIISLLIPLILIGVYFLRTKNASLEELKNENIKKFGITGFFPENGSPTSTSIVKYFNDVSEVSGIYGINTKIDDIKHISLASKYLKPNIVINLVIDSNDWGKVDKETLDAFLFVIKDNKRIKYIAIGNEINHKYDFNSREYKEFSKNFDKLKQLIKESRSDIKVYTVFQYEDLVNKAKQSEIIYNDFKNRIEIFGITTYPYHKYSEVSKIPSEYFAKVKKTNTQFIITETAWPSDDKDKLKLYKATQEEQVKYYEYITKQCENNCLGYMWLGVNDLDTRIQNKDQLTFKYLGLKDIEGNPKLLWNEFEE